MAANSTRTVVLIGLIAFCQVLCVGANFSTLKFYSESLGGTGLAVGLLWTALAMPRAVLSPFWGSVSDVWGRKPMLVLGSVGSILGSFLWAHAGTWNVLLASRAIDSLLGAQATIGFSVIADVTPPERRASAMGLAGAMVLAGFTLGPAIGAFAAAEWGYHVLGCAMAVVQSIGLLLVLFALPETRPASVARHRILPDAFRPSAWRSVFGSATLSRLLVGSMVLIAAFSVYNTAFPNAAEAWLDWTERDVAWAFVVLGVGGAISQGVLVRRLAPRLGERRLVAAGAVLMIAGFTALSVRTNAGGLLLATGVLAVGGGLAFPCLTAMLSRAASDDRQGLVMGLNQMAQGLGRGAGFLAGSAFATKPALLTLPYWIAVGALALGAAALPGGRGTQATGHRSDSPD